MEKHERAKKTQIEISPTLLQTLKNIVENSNPEENMITEFHDGRTFVIFTGNDAEQRALYQLKRLPEHTIPITDVVRVYQDVYAFIL